MGIAIRKPIIKVTRNDSRMMNKEKISFEKGCASDNEFLILK
jgi:hypothetical protein